MRAFPCSTFSLEQRPAKKETRGFAHAPWPVPKGQQWVAGGFSRRIGGAPTGQSRRDGRAPWPGVLSRSLPSLRDFAGSGARVRRLKPPATHYAPFGSKIPKRLRFRPLVCAVLCLAAILGASGLASAAAPARIARTLAALDELDRVCQEAEKRGAQVLYHRIPLIVERHVLVELDADNKDRDRILDHIYESCLRARAEVLEGADARRPPVPPPPELAAVSFKDGFCVAGDAVAFPVVADSCPRAIQPFFAKGELRRLVPALAGTTPEAFEQSAVARLYNDDPASRRVGWDRPAGGFVRGDALICLDHQGVRQAIAEASAQAIAAWPKDSKPLYVSLGSEPFYADFSDLARDRFAAWLKERYKTVRTLNLVWGTELADFQRGLLPTPDQAAASASRWCDFADFNHARLTAHVRWAAGSVRAAAPGLPLGLPPLRYAFAGSFALSGADPLALAEILDVLEVSGQSVEEADLAFALAAGKRPVVNPNLVPGTFGLIPQQLHGVAAARLPAWPRE
ncbi:MAG: hypothetical protein FJ291_16385, partial [Planctomycetes bacterium]|nr:hypothetical protein [Planctomycetota bacterium]